MKTLGWLFLLTHPFCSLETSVKKPIKKKDKNNFPKLIQETNIIPQDLPVLTLISTCSVNKCVHTVFSLDFAAFCQG